MDIDGGLVAGALSIVGGALTMLMFLVAIWISSTGGRE